MRPIQPISTMCVGAAALAGVSISAGFVPLKVAQASSSQIVFVSNRSGIVSGTPNGNEIYTMNADGSNVVPLTTNAHAEWKPQWNPGNSKIAFASNELGNWDVCVLDISSKLVTNLTLDSTAYDFGSTWSPDGSTIAFTSDRDGNYEVYLLNLASGIATRFTNHAATDRDFTWAPDGNRYAFVSDRTGNFEIYVGDLRYPSVAPTQLTNNVATDYLPQWSPDGTKIAFTTNRDGNYEVYSMSANGTSVKRLTSNQAEDQESSWSPDGKKLLFTSYRNGNYEIYSMSSDGKGSPTRLTNTTPFGDWNASWKRP